jgi:hypothetical protein
MKMVRRMVWRAKLHAFSMVPPPPRLALPAKHSHFHLELEQRMVPKPPANVNADASGLYHAIVLCDSTDARYKFLT